MKANRMRHRDTSAFTLVEVVVVLATIALLTALLMPALARVRLEAREIVCRSNLHQLVLANTAYATEHHGYYVPAASDLWASAGLRRWHGTRSRLAEPFDPRRGPLAGYLAEGQVKECPARVAFLKGQNWSRNYEQGGGGYGYNMMYLGSRLWEPSADVASAGRRAYTHTTAVTEVRNPAQTLMFADTAMANDGSSLIEYSFAEPPFAVFGGQVMMDVRMSPSIHFRHAGQANIGWTDGHIGSEPMAPLAGSNVYGVKSSALGLGWFAPVDNTPFDLR
jgi:prepilin-type processing-associated H-X9-DG protein